MIDFDKAGGLVPAIAQDADTGQVLMLAWMNREAYEETLRTGRAGYFSRSRNKLWRKGEESGHVQEVREVYVDCDADTVLLKVRRLRCSRLPRRLRLLLLPQRSSLLMPKIQKWNAHASRERHQHDEDDSRGALHRFYTLDRRPPLLTEAIQWLLIVGGDVELAGINAVWRGRRERDGPADRKVRAVIASCAEIDRRREIGSETQRAHGEGGARDFDDCVVGPRHFVSRRLGSPDAGHQARGSATANDARLTDADDLIGKCRATENDGPKV